MILVKSYDGLRVFLENCLDSKQSKKTFSLISKGNWEKFVARNSANAFLFYRGDITAPQTHCVGLFSENETFGGAGGSWVLHATKEESKLLVMWFNSAMNLFQILTQRKETRGGWMELDLYVLEELYILDSRMLTQEERESLFKTFDKVAKSPLPSIHEQLRNKHPARKELDTALLRIIGMPEDEIETFLVSLYEQLDRELTKLKEVMAEGRHIEKEE